MKRRRVRLSVATKIFLGFAVVILAFGTASAFTLYRMSALRQTVTVLWKELTPMSNQLRGLSRQLKSAEEFIAMKRPNDAQWLQQVLPALEPFSGSNGFATLAERLDGVSRSDALAAPDRAELAVVAGGFRAFSTGPALAELLAGDDLPDVLASSASGPPPSSEVYERLVRRTLKVASLGSLTASSIEARATARVLRRLNREVNDAVRALAGPIRAIDLRTEESERSSRIFAVLIAGLALLVSIAMLAIALFTLRPIRKLREGARKIAAGDYAGRVQVGSSDEIGQLAEEFNRMAASLEERDKALADKQRELVGAERLAAVGRLAAQITHEVRNPLSSIGLNAELLEDELDDLAGRSDGAAGDHGTHADRGPADATAARAMLRSISAEVQRLKDITEQYLQLTRFSRVPGRPGEPPSLEAPTRDEAESLPTLSAPEPVPCDVLELVRSFASFLRPEAELAGVALEVIAPALPVPAIQVDPDQIRQALLNVSKNALDSLKTVEGDRRIRIFVDLVQPLHDDEHDEREPLMGRLVRMRIEDNGPGLPPELKDRLFTPFITTKAHGTGLGLAVTRDIVRAHGGDVRLTSPLGPHGGTAVELLLPVR